MDLDDVERVGDTEDDFEILDAYGNGRCTYFLEPSDGWVPAFETDWDPIASPYLVRNRHVVAWRGEVKPALYYQKEGIIMERRYFQVWLVPHQLWRWYFHDHPFI